jgi:hypothetical protein
MTAFGHISQSRISVKQSLTKILHEIMILTVQNGIIFQSSAEELAKRLSTDIISVMIDVRIPVSYPRRVYQKSQKPQTQLSL